MKKFLIYMQFLSCGILLPVLSFSQTITWQEDFNNGCSSGCLVASYTGPNGAWLLTNIGVQGNKANQWFVSCAENGEVVGACGAGCGNNATLHVGSVPCSFCPCGTDCGAAYNAGPTILNINPTTHKRAESPLIDCSAQSGLSLSFKYIGRGQDCFTDYCNLVFSDDGGATWSNLQTCLTSTWCGNSQGRWTLFNISLPSSADNNANVKLGFEWQNNSDGQGNDPSFAVDSMVIYTFTGSAPTANFSASDSDFCSLTCIDFTDESMNSPTSWNWSFPGASPNTSALQNPTNICYNSPGVYDVTLITGNAFGADTLTLSGYVNVNAPPLQPAITQSNDTLTCSPANSYQWYFNSNIIPGATGQQLIITQSGDYSVIITDSVGCSASDTIAAVFLLPQSAFSSNAISGCENSCFDFTNTSLNATSYQWFFPGGNPASSLQQNPSNICYANSGVFDVTLIASSNFGSDTLTLFNYITIYATPLQPVITQSNDTLKSSAAYSYQWFMNGYIIPGATNQQLIITQSGDYTVTITDSVGCSSSDTIAALLLFPQSAFSSNAISGCSNSCFDFTNASLNATTYQWFFPGGNPASSSQQNPSNICYAIPGVYDVILIASSNFSSDTLVQAAYITIFTPLTASISQNGNILTCNPATSSYQWLLNGNQIPGATSQTLFITQTGIYIVDITDSNGCAAADTLTVNNIPSPNFSVTDTSLCEKFCTNFFDQSTNNPTAWLWLFPGGDPSSSTLQDPTNICYNSSGIYDVTLITTGANGSDTLTLPNFLIVYPTPPLPVITQVDYTLTSSAASSYQWQFNTVDIPGATNQSYTIMQSGYYTVIVGDSNGCVSSVITYILISGIGDVNDDAGISIYPNPSSGSFIVEFSYAQASENEWLNGPDLFGTGEVSIDVLNPVGQIIFSVTESPSTGVSSFKKEIDLSAVMSGIYFIEIKTANLFLRKKILIAK